MEEEVQKYEYSVKGQSKSHITNSREHTVKKRHYTGMRCKTVVDDLRKAAVTCWVRLSSTLV
jgi:hypothetical protein